MKAIAHNVIPLVTCPSFWFWHAIGAIVCIPAVTYPIGYPDPATGCFAAPFALAIWSGYVVGSLLKDPLLKPFTFCMPGYRRVFRLTAMLLGLAVGPVAALPALSYPGLDTTGSVAAFWSALCCAEVAYLLTLSAVIATQNVNTLVAPFVILGVLCLEVLEVRLFVQELALFSPIMNPLILGGLGWLLWRRAGTAAFARNLCGGRFLSLQVAWNRTAAEEFAARGRLDALEGRPRFLRSWLSGSLARLARPARSALRQHVAAASCEMVGRFLPVSRKGPALLMLLVPCLLAVIAYAQPRADRPEHIVANAVYLFPFFAGIMMQPPILTTSLLPVGRRERFWTFLIISTMTGLLALVSAAVLVGVLLGASAIAPPLTLGGRTFTFRPADPALWYVPLVLAPVVHWVQIVFRKWAPIPLVILFTAAWITIVGGAATLSTLGLPAVAMLVVGSWGLLVGSAYTHCFYKDLTPA